MNSKEPLGWVGFFTQFFFGALVGAGIGVGVLSKSPFAGSPSYTPLICFMAGGALIFGLIAGFIKDEFWRNLRL
jgi:hypothetical protein